jgi:uncharacterized protein
MVKRFLFLVCLVLALMLIGETVYVFQTQVSPPTSVPTPPATPVPKPLLAYTFENLKNTQFPANAITLGPVVNEDPYSVARKFYYCVPQNPGSTVMLQVSGLMNVPKQAGRYPVIVLFRGYVPPDTFQSGAGTQPAARVFVQNGFITLAPDFLGFGESASPSTDPFEARFQTYTSALTLLASLSTLNAGLNDTYAGTVTADLTKVGLWGHSNGGHITLSVLAISGVPYPTVLWAPVSASFPFSILFYTGDTDDHGKAMRQFLAKFEVNYDTELFSPPNYYAWIQAPIQIHQGMADDIVPNWWSSSLAKTLSKNVVPADYFVYPGADHNLRSSGWSMAVQRSLDFFGNHFSKK